MTYIKDSVLRSLEKSRDHWEAEAEAKRLKQQLEGAKSNDPTIEHFVSEAVRLHSFAHPDGQRYINAGDLVMMVSDMQIVKEN